jgi:hypothetical protein
MYAQQPGGCILMFFLSLDKSVTADILQVLIPAADVYIDVVGHGKIKEEWRFKMNPRTLLTRFWFEFEVSNVNDLPAGLTWGCGITAYNYNDAISILGQRVFKGQEIPKIVKRIKNIDIRTLDQGHVVVNMKDPTLRGIWFPYGY